MSDVPGKTRRKHTLFIISQLCVKNGPNLIVVGCSEIFGRSPGGSFGNDNDDGSENVF